ncbi:MAG: tautomerase [Rhodospirillaceae bacterium]|nr:tautomerase [Rhodospirillaceae bacterium]|tara:strand:- start:74 stop:445 length:372 start_codon:yes stop_codon:yes gene_type:complete
MSVEKAKVFMSAMENRDLKTANSCLDVDTLMTFPGGNKLENLNEVIDWSRSRYKFVNKTIDSVEEILNKDLTVIYIIGTLHGEWLDGKSFKDIRFIDRFVFRDARIVDLKVWNDLAEFRGRER